MPDLGARDNVLVFAYGNSSRGDDALAPLLLKKIQQSEAELLSSEQINVLQDFQMQVEHVVDMQGCQMALLIDADQSQSSAIRFFKVEEETSSSYTTHGMAPGQLLAVYRRMYQSPAPATFMLAIRGYDFELGKPLTPQAEENLDMAKAFLVRLLHSRKLELWLELAGQD